MIPPEAEQREAFEAIGSKVVVVSKGTTESQAFALASETSCDERDAVLSAQDSLEFTIPFSTIPQVTQTEPIGKTPTGNDETIFNMDRMAARERELAQAARIADAAMMASTSKISIDVIAQLSEEIAEKNRLEKKRQEAIPDPIFRNLDGLDLAIVRKKATEIDQALSGIAPGEDRIPADLGLCNNLIYWNFDNETIGEILQHYRPYQMADRNTYFAKTITIASERTDRYDPAKKIAKAKAAEIAKTPPSTLAKAINHGALVFIGKAEKIEDLRDLALYILYEGRGEPDAIKTVGRAAGNLPEADRPTGEKVIELVETAGENLAAARRCALAAAMTLQRETKPVPLTPEEIEHQEMIELFTYNENGKTRLDDVRIADWLHLKYNTISFSGLIYVYNQKTGVYLKNDMVIESKIAEIVKKTETREQLTRVTREVLAHLTYLNPQQEYPFNQTQGIPVANGVISINYYDETVDLLLHSPEYRFTYHLPVTYDLTADGAPMREVFSEYVDPDEVNTLFEIPAIALLQMNGSKPFKRSYLLQGDTNSGKSTFLEIVELLIGEENISGVSLREITNDKFCFADMEGCVLNMHDEMKDVPLEDVEDFKKITGKFRQRIERKHEHAYYGDIKCVHVFTCNDPPEIPAKMVYNSAWWSRWEYLNFTNSFEIDRTYKDRVMTPAALSGLLNDVIQTMLYVQKNGFYREPDPGRVKDSWKLASDPFAEFLWSEMIPTKDRTSTFDKGSLLASFRRWCVDQGKNQRKIPESAKTFAPMIFRNGFFQKQIGKEKTRVYAGAYRWKEGSKYENPF